MISVLEAKKFILEKYGFKIIEKSDLGEYEGQPIKGEAHLQGEITIKNDLNDTMKLITIVHEAGHLIEYKRVGVAWLHGTALRFETKAWLNGLPIAIEIGILNEYINYWKVHLDKL